MAAAVLGSGILRQAADAYDRAARAPYGRIPTPSAAGNRLRQAARIISVFAHLARDPALRPSCHHPAGRYDADAKLDAAG